MCRRVSLEVAVIPVPWYDFFKLGGDILGDTGIGMLINHDSGGGMRYEYIANTAFHTTLFNNASNLTGDVL